MASSHTVIANQALAFAGVGKTIADLDTDSSQNAMTCRIFYEDDRDALLRKYDWPFARARVTLTLVASDPTDEWPYSYRYPPDCLYAIRIPSGVRTPAPEERNKFRIAQDTNGLLIYSDQDTADLIYTKRETRVTIYPSDFVRALALKLALSIMPLLSKGDQFKRTRGLMLQFQSAMEDANATARNEESPDQEPDSIFIRDR